MQVSFAWSKPLKVQGMTGYAKVLIFAPVCSPVSARRGALSRGGGDDHLLRSAARRNAGAARLGKPHEFNLGDGL
jgi:hypothetical protein